MHEQGPGLRLSPGLRRNVSQRLLGEVRRSREAGHEAVILCGAEIRPALRRLLEIDAPRLAVLSFEEITRDTRVENVAMVALPAEAAAA